MDISQAVEVVVNKIKKTGWNQTKAIKKLWANHLHTLSREARDQLAQEGLQGRVGQALTRGTQFAQVQGEQVEVTVTKVSGERDLSILINVLYQCPDGSEKQLIHFTVEDFKYCIERSRQQIQGLQITWQLFELGCDLLKRYRVDEISKLPIDEQQKFAEAWEERKLTTSVAA